jgi:hypothetical protein
VWTGLLITLRQSSYVHDLYGIFIAAQSAHPDLPTDFVDSIVDNYRAIPLSA